MSKDRKTLLIIGAVLLLAGGIYRFWPSVNSLFIDDAELNMKLQRIAKYQRKIKTEPQLQAELTTLTRYVERSERILIDGSTPALAAAHVQNMINEIAYENQLTIDSLSVKKTKDVENIAGFIEVPIQVRLTCSITQLYNLIYKLESASNLLSIKEMHIRRLPQVKGDLLTVQLTICGYMTKL